MNIRLYALDSHIYYNFDYYWYLRGNNAFI